MALFKISQYSSPKNSRDRLVIAAILLSCLGLPSGCKKEFTDKHTAEESGYFSQFRPAFEAACQVGTTRQVQSGVMPVEMPCGGSPQGMSGRCTQYVPTYTTINIQWLSDSGVNAVDVSVQLDNTLPPVGLVQAQRLLGGALPLELHHDPGLRDQSQKVCQAYLEFERSVETRTESYETTDSVYITYKPPGISMLPGSPGIKYDSRTGLGFELEQSLTIPTPYGSITTGYKEAPGIHMLRVVSEGKQRYLTLDRPFEFYVPKGYSTTVAYEGKDELVLLVGKT